MQLNHIASIGLLALGRWAKNSAACAISRHHTAQFPVGLEETPITATNEPQISSFTFEPISSSSSTSSTSIVFPTQTPTSVPLCHLGINSSFTELNDFDYLYLREPPTPLMEISFVVSDNDNTSLGGFSSGASGYSGFYPNSLVINPNSNSSQDEVGVQLLDRPRTYLFEGDDFGARDPCWKYADPRTWGFELTLGGRPKVDTWMTNTSGISYCTFGNWVQDESLDGLKTLNSREIECYFPC